MSTIRRKLIEVSLPLEAINVESAREKSIRHGHPSTIHLWWARRPLATARAVLFAQLVDDPSSNEEEYRAEALRRGMPADRIDGYIEGRVAAERERLHAIIRKLVVWTNINDDVLYRQAYEEILNSTGGNPPPILDPFAGGGTIPLEAQRLGLTVQSSDLNPVAVLINKALIEIPTKFAGRPPIFPGTANLRLGPWANATGLAEDVRRYAEWMRDEAEKRIAHLYPAATLADGSKATVIAWIWARVISCPNPACGIRMPLVRSWWLGKKKGKEAYVIPEALQHVNFTIGHDPKLAPGKDGDGTVDRTGATCIGCGSAVPLDYIRAEGRAGRMGTQLMATVAEGNRQRIYLAPTDEHEKSADVPRPDYAPEGKVATNPRWFSTPAFGMTEFSDLFTSRQLTALITLSDLVAAAREHVISDARSSGMREGARLVEGGADALAYADAVATYLALALDRFVDYSSSISTWASNPKNEGIRNTFGRQAIPMTWDFAEVYPFSESSGNFFSMARAVAIVIEKLPAKGSATAIQADAAKVSMRGFAVSTDPPYYDNIGYSDLSDFFHVWLRRALRDVYPQLFATLLVPKTEELVANPYRHGGKVGAKQFFENGFQEVFSRARGSVLSDFPIAVYYAFKQAETESAGTASTGWQTLLEGMISSGWAITGTWPMRSELGNRMIASGTNALASSIVLALRPRLETAEATTRRGFLSALKAELPTALRELQQGAIAPVDLAQAAIGPGMAVFTRYGRVVEADGSAMSVRTALSLINHALDEVLTEQEGEFDGDTRFCVKWFTQFGWATRKYGDAETLANSVNISVQGLVRGGVFQARAGEARLFGPVDLSSGWDPLTDERVSVWEATIRIAKCLDEQGGPAAATLMARAAQRVDLNAVQELAYLLYNVCERAHRSKDALLFNGLGTSWADLAMSARAGVTQRQVQGEFEFDGEDEG